jgi:hypothetical protein
MSLKYPYAFVRTAAGKNRFRSRFFSDRTKLNSVAWVRERAIPLVSEISANFCE